MARSHLSDVGGAQDESRLLSEEAGNGTVVAMADTDTPRGY